MGISGCFPCLVCEFDSRPFKIDPEEKGEARGGKEGGREKERNRGKTKSERQREDWRIAEYTSSIGK